MTPSSFQATVAATKNVWTSRAPGLFGARDALFVMLVLIDDAKQNATIPQSEMTKEEFIAAMGGPNELVGTSTVTVGELATALEVIFKRLTFPGIRVFDPQSNRDNAWRDLNALDD